MNSLVQKVGNVRQSLESPQPRNAPNGIGPRQKPTASPSSAGGILAASSRDHARGNPRANQGDDGPPPVDAEQNRYAVECILGRRVHIRRLRGRDREVIQYRVRWEGDGPRHDQWRDEDDIDPPLIKAYDATVGDAMVKGVEEDERASNVAELIEDHRTQRSSRSRSRRQLEDSDELLLLKYRREGRSWG